MAFIRTFDAQNISKMKTGDIVDNARFTYSSVGKYLKLDAQHNATLFALLKEDVAVGKVFPALRNNELHFYYKGGCLYKFLSGVFYRDSNYDLYSANTDGLSSYEKAKKQNENKYTNAKGGVTERQRLDDLYCHTFDIDQRTNVVVLDIEVNLKGTVGWGKKCDLVFLNTATNELMFVEGKVFSDDRVRSAVGYIPRVIEQVNIYTQAIAEQRNEILVQYSEHIRIINELFGTSYQPPKALIEPAKLLVYQTGGGKAVNTQYTIDIINEKLGVGNVMWVENDDTPTIDEIWQALMEDKCK